MAVEHPAGEERAGAESAAPRRSEGHAFWLGLIFATIAFALGVVGWHYAHIAFTPPPPASQIYAAVFVRDPAARVSLNAVVYPNAPWNDGLTITVTGVSGRKAGWVLVIECPAGAPSLARSVHLYSETTLLTAPPKEQVTAYPGVDQRQGQRAFLVLQLNYAATGYAWVSAEPGECRAARVADRPGNRAGHGGARAVRAAEPPGQHGEPALPDLPGSHLPDGDTVALAIDLAVVVVRLAGRQFSVDFALTKRNCIPIGRVHGFALTVIAAANRVSGGHRQSRVLPAGASRRHLRALLPPAIGDDHRNTQGREHPGIPGQFDVPGRHHDERG
jgi:hypothetical protein